jgi:AcrR family transcriptional regulator
MAKSKSPEKIPRRPGIERRTRLLRAARSLLARTDMTDINLPDVARLAGIPTSSAYFFYGNIEDLYLHLLAEIDSELVAEISRPLRDTPFSWQEVIKSLIARGVRFYAKHPAARQLITGPRTPPELKLRDRQNDVSLGHIFQSQVARYFVIPELRNGGSIFYRAVEIADLMFCLSVLEHGKITSTMADEAANACIAYLQFHIGEKLPRR